MKFRIFIILNLCILLFSQNALSQDEKNEKFRRGSEYFSAGDFEKALDAWIDLYNTGFRSAGLEYNIGNAYFKMNNIPGAILFYERASLLKPADEDINYNLQIARTLAVDRFEEIPELFFVRWYDFMALMLSSEPMGKNKYSLFYFMSSFNFGLFLLPEIQAQGPGLLACSGTPVIVCTLSYSFCQEQKTCLRQR